MDTFFPSLICLAKIRSTFVLQWKLPNDKMPKGERKYTNIELSQVRRIG